MRFIWFAITNFLMGMIFPYIFSILMMASLLPLTLLDKRVEKIPWYFNPFIFLPGLLQLFIILWWDAYLAEKTIVTTNHESVQYGWIYVIAAFLSAAAPLRYMAGQEDRMDRQAGEPENPRKTLGQLLYITLSAVGFLVFYFYPPPMHFLYGWFLHWWFGV